MTNLLRALRPLAWDFLATIVFASLVAAHVDVRIATGLGLAVGIGQVVGMRLLGRRIDHLQWSALGLTLVFGTASLVTHDPRFVMAKPSLIYAAIAVVMLKRGWMLRYLPPVAQGHGDDLMIRWGYVWSGLMALTALANGVVAIWFTPAWAAFIAVVPLASKLGLFAIQYVSLRIVIRRRIIAARQAEATAGALPQAA
jgi:intracellular septation protein A